MNYYYPKRPIKSFQDLEVYQKSLAICVIVVKMINKMSLRSRETVEGEAIPSTLSAIVLSLPIKIATAHSLRFSDQNKAIQILEEVMLNCNLLVVYLELYRDLGPAAKIDPPTTGEADIADVDINFFEEQIKNLLSLRMKIMHLQQSWKKFFQIKSLSTGK